MDRRVFEQYFAALANDNPEIRKNSLAKIVESYNKNDWCAFECLDEEELAIVRFNDDRLKKLMTAAIKLLSDQDPSTRLLVTKIAAMSADVQDRKLIAKLFKDTNDEVRAAAAGAFVDHYVDDDQSLQDLEHLLNDRSPKVRLNAAKALAGYRKSRIIKALVEAYAMEPNEEIKGDILGALGQ